MLDKDIIELLRCPHCAPQDGGVLTEQHSGWLSCSDCQAHYPVVQDIPVMLPEEGERWRGKSLSELPVIDSHNRFAAAG